MTETESEKEVQALKDDEREEKKKIRDLLLNNHHSKAEHFPSVVDVTDYGLEADEYVGLLKQMHKDGELEFSIENGQIDDVSSEAFFSQGVEDVELVKGLRNMANAMEILVETLTLFCSVYSREESLCG